MSDLSIKNSEDSFCVEDFEYDLPFELIAQEPLLERAKSKLMHLDKTTGDLAHGSFENLLELLIAGDVLVLNNTKVIPARLIAKRYSGGMIKMLLLKQVGSSPRVWEALVTPIKRLKPGEILTVPTESGQSFEISVVDIEVGFDGFKRLIVDLGEPDNVWQMLNQAGYAPLPPYIMRDYREDSQDESMDECAHESQDEPTHGSADARTHGSPDTPTHGSPDARTHGSKVSSQGNSSVNDVAPKDISRRSDLDRYQTVFAKEPGAVAAPTAGLHFTEGLIDALRAKGVHVHYLTLHVGAGTFKPMASSLDEHKIEPERFSISQETATAINSAKLENRRVIAVGTTSLRALETAGATGSVDAVEDGVTHLFVKPGYQFKIADGLITNFHLSKSSLLVLVSAFAGRNKIMRAYTEAIDRRYRFYSYGDAMLIL